MLVARPRFLLMSLVLSSMMPLTVASAGDIGFSSSGLPFQIGEQFAYEISWMHITAGTAVMSVIADIDGDRPLVKLVTVAQSRPAISKVFPVDNRLESLLDPETRLPEHLTFRRREGKKNEDIEYTFHQKAGTVTEVKGGVTDTLPILPHTQDAISCLYYLRNELTTTPGSSLTMNVYHDKKTHTLEVRVEEAETLSGTWGELEAIRVVVVMPAEGLFRNRGTIRVWFTSDDRRIPLRMEAKVFIGTIVANLVSGMPAASSIQQATEYPHGEELRQSTEGPSP